MSDEAHWTALMRVAAAGLVDRFKAALDDPSATSVELTRDEAVLALGLIEGMHELLTKEDGADPGSGAPQ